MTICINGREYNLATTLRVAYTIQGQHNHEPYSKVFERVGSMTLEDQINIVYAAFVCANPNEAATYNASVFRNYMLDNFNLKDLLDLMKGIIEGIMGKFETDDSEAVATEAVEGNVL